ncbi:DUF4407 domain-containing protein [Actinomycetospora sp. CA-084318]|uniref:DUF4407 domain-containing protein n=1 Tax=Actinomycetospora sp. CA-084318 TaxID=3239892 RepID=UPI003D9932DA
MTPSLFLARIAGARTDVLARTPSDTAKFATTGGVILSTALVGAASAYFALTTAVGFGPVVALVVALAWGVIVLNLDRMLVVSMRRGDGFVRTATGVLVRLLLAAVIGTVISTPMTLQIFKPEIDGELVVMQNEQRQQSRAEIDRTFAQRAPLEAKIAQLEAVASGRERASAAADPDVISRQRAFDAAQAAYEQAEQAAICETQGIGCPGGSGTPGIGALQKQKQAFADGKKAERDAVRRDLDAATARAEARIDASGPQLQQQARDQLPAAQAELAALTGEQARFEASAADAAENGGGLLARLEALSRLSAGNGTMQLAHLAVFLLFFLIELLPVIVKVLALTSRETTYDTILAREDVDVLADDEDERQRDDDTRRRVRDAIEADRADRMIEAGKDATAHIMETHRAVSRRAVDVWAHVAMARSDEQLRAWYAAQSSGPFPLGPAAPEQDAPVVIDAAPDDEAVTRPIPLSALQTLEIPIQATASARPVVRN